MRNRTRNTNPQQRILLGVFILFIGVLSLADNLNIFSTRELLQFWPVVFILLGVMKMLQAKSRSGSLIGGALILAGVIMILNHLGLIHIRMREWWPLLLIAGGLLVIFKDRTVAAIPEASTGTVPLVESDSRLDIVAVMSGHQGQIASRNFLGGEITAIMGGVDLDLSAASIHSEAVLNVFAVWGSIHLKVPTDWTVINNGIAILGGIDDKSGPVMLASKRLVINGYAVMGSVEIEN